MSAICFNDDTATRMVKGTRNTMARCSGGFVGFGDVASVIERRVGDHLAYAEERDQEWLDGMFAQWRAAERLAQEHGE